MIHFCFVLHAHLFRVFVSALYVGSAVFKSLTPAFLSSVIYLLLYKFTDIELDTDPDSDDAKEILGHPYTIGAFVSALTFLLTFRLSFSYNRYWEACTAVHQMHSKWLDVGIDMAAFHLQSDRYDDRKPPAFGAHPDIKCLERERERLLEPTMEELENQLEGVSDGAPSLRSRFTLLKKKRSTKPKPAAKPKTKPRTAVKSINAAAQHKPPQHQDTFGFQQLNRLLFRKDAPKTVVKITTGERKNQYDPSPFLLEGAHLLSLLSACAMSTLRNDLEQAESPLTTFKPGQPWPHVDPDDYSADVRKDWDMSTHRTWVVVKYLFGFSRTPATRTLYNAARPFRVVGGVSDAEISLLQSARGPMAKVALW